MKPENSADNFFGQVVGRISTASVHEFVADHHRLEASLGRKKTFGQQNDGIDHAERNGRIDIRRDAELSLCANSDKHLIEDWGCWLVVRYRLRGFAESAKSY